MSCFLYRVVLERPSVRVLASAVDDSVIHSTSVTVHTASSDTLHAVCVCVCVCACVRAQSCHRHRHKAQNSSLNIVGLPRFERAVLSGSVQVCNFCVKQ